MFRGVCSQERGIYGPNPSWVRWSPLRPRYCNWVCELWTVILKIAPSYVGHVHGVCSMLPTKSDLLPNKSILIQINTSARILFQKPRSISIYKKANWDGMKQALEAYHQYMLESGKYSSLNAVQLWDDLHSTLTSLTNKFIPSKLSSTRNNLPWVNQKLKRIAR